MYKAPEYTFLKRKPKDDQRHMKVILIIQGMQMGTVRPLTCNRMFIISNMAQWVKALSLMA